ncbi:hypothetical protein B0H16DRAFT_1614221 [Mycena metata]|uniref:Uncharacterized protein n=1 Tax=Mycena metata TaxID=1033252 RepID=A0AAD7HAZ8_9AGAR|nr:hypothetical protein B0H16DRAFT_1614221 [Mycena metata]
MRGTRGEDGDGGRRRRGQRVRRRRYGGYCTRRADSVRVHMWARRLDAHEERAAATSARTRSSHQAWAQVHASSTRCIVPGARGCVAAVYTRAGGRRERRQRRRCSETSEGACDGNGEEKGGGTRGGWGWGDGRGESMCAVGGLEAHGVPAHTWQQYLAAGAGALCGGAHEGGTDAGNGDGDGGAVRRDGTREREEGGGGAREEDGHGEMGWGGSMCAVRILEAHGVPARTW